MSAARSLIAVTDINIYRCLLTSTAQITLTSSHTASKERQSQVLEAQQRRMTASSTTLVTAVAVAASLFLGPALATSSSHPDPDISRPQNLNSDGPVLWQKSQDAAAHVNLKGDQVNHDIVENESAEGGVSVVTLFESTLTQEPQSDSGVPGSEGAPLDWQPELKRSEDGGEEKRTVLLRRETSAAPTIYGFSIWLILAWLALLYLMYKTGSL